VASIPGRVPFLKGKNRKKKNFQGRVPKELSVRYRLFSEKMATKHLYPDFGFLEKNM
jgi:hypothetical protein